MCGTLELNHVRGTACDKSLQAMAWGRLGPAQPCMHGDRASPEDKQRDFSRWVMSKSCSGLQAPGRTRPCLYSQPVSEWGPVNEYKQKHPSLHSPVSIGYSDSCITGLRKDNLNK